MRENYFTHQRLSLTTDMPASPRSVHSPTLINLTGEGSCSGEDPQVARDAQRQHGRRRSEHCREQALLAANHVAEPPEHGARNERQQPVRFVFLFNFGMVGGGEIQISSASVLF